MSAKGDRYRQGVHKANETINGWLSQGDSAKVAMRKANECHEAFDYRQYRQIADGKDSEYARGIAMGYGMYANTGLKLKG
mgnify:FL=1